MWIRRSNEVVLKHDDTASFGKEVTTDGRDFPNAILDGTSALMLSGETAVGAHPIDAVRTMDQIARAVEPSMSSCG